MNFQTNYLFNCIIVATIDICSGSHTQIAPNEKGKLDIASNAFKI